MIGFQINGNNESGCIKKSRKKNEKRIITKNIYLQNPQQSNKGF